MTDQNVTQQQSDSTERVGGESRFTLMVTGLLVVIMVALAGLWLRERGQRIKFQQRGAALKKALEETQARALFAGLGGTPVDAALVSKLQMMAANTPPQGEQQQFTVVREELATMPMKVDGKNVQVLQLSGTIGKRAGFIPGDMIYITRPPTNGGNDRLTTPVEK